MPTDINQEIEHYLRTGEHDQNFLAWLGEDLFARAKHGGSDLLEALISAVRQRTPCVTMPEPLIDLDVTAFTRAKFAPMVGGLFPQEERSVVLDMLSHSAVFLMPDNVDTVLRQSRWLGTAWDLANLYLAGFDRELLSEQAPLLAGLSEETTCYLSLDYFHTEDTFEDFLVHEAAHVFHNCKRETIGLRKIRGREWLLEIDFTKRELFAYACEAYSRILTLGKGRGDRRMRLVELEQMPMPADERVDAAEYVDVLREAVEARNGWKHILERCSDHQPARRYRLGDA